MNVDPISALLGVLGGAIAGAIAVFFGSLLIPDLWRSQKQKKFADGLEEKLGEYKKKAPSGTPEEIQKEIEKRRSVVGKTVQDLSYRIFGTGSPIAGFSELPDVQFPEVACKWCHQSIPPVEGSEGACPNCALPFCFWCPKESD